MQNKNTFDSKTQSLKNNFDRLNKKAETDKSQVIESSILRNLISLPTIELVAKHLFNREFASNIRKMGEITYTIKLIKSKKGKNYPTYVIDFIINREFGETLLNPKPYCQYEVIKQDKQCFVVTRIEILN